MNVSFNVLNWSRVKVLECLLFRIEKTIDYEMDSFTSDVLFLSRLYKEMNQDSFDAQKAFN